MNVMLINREWISLSPEHRNVIRANHRTARWEACSRSQLGF